MQRVNSEKERLLKFTQFQFGVDYCSLPNITTMSTGANAVDNCLFLAMIFRQVDIVTTPIWSFFGVLMKRLECETEVCRAWDP